MIRFRGLVISFILICADSIFIFIVFRITTTLRVFLTPIFDMPHVSWVKIIPIMYLGYFLIILIFIFQGLYPGYGMTSVIEFEKIGKSTFFSFIILSGVSFINKDFNDFPRSVIIMAFLILFISLPIFHFLLRNILSRFKFYGVPVILFGEKSIAQKVAVNLSNVRRMGWRPHKIESIANIDNISISNRNAISILISPKDFSVAKSVYKLNQIFKKVIIIQNSETLGSLWIKTRDIEGLLGLEIQYHLLSIGNLFIKRLVDIFVSFLLLILLSPLLILISISLAISSKGPIFFQQERLGKDFSTIKITKFRSMIINGNEKLQEILEKDPESKAEYEKYHKLKSDPRFTRLGRILRKFSLDELPQLWNVFKGDMSLSGPRAYMNSELSKMGLYSETILRIKPGITGWWQVFDRHNSSFQKRLTMDEYYISNWSLWMDAYIFLRTILVIILGKGI